MARLYSFDFPVHCMRAYALKYTRIRIQTVRAIQELLRQNRIVIKLEKGTHLLMACDICSL